MLTLVRVIIGVLASTKVAILTGLGLVYSAGGAITLPVAGVAILGSVVLASVVLFTFGKSVRLAALVSSLGIVVFVLPLGVYNHHTYLLAVVLAIFALGVHTALMLKLQLTVVYFYAAVTKLNETYLSGTELYVSLVEQPFWQAVVGVAPAPWFLIALAALSIVVELFLAAGFWFRRTRWIALVVGVGFHLTLLITMPQSRLMAMELATYGGTLCALYIPFFAPEIDAALSRRRQKSPAHSLAASSSQSGASTQVPANEI